MKKIEIENSLNDELEKQLNILAAYFEKTDDVNETSSSLERSEEWFKKFSNNHKEHNIYAYYIKSVGVWELFYLGQTHSDYSIQRMRQHLIKASKTTNSKLAELKNIDELGFKSIIIEPQELRHYFEIMLIQKLKPDHKNLSNKLLK